MTALVKMTFADGTVSAKMEAIEAKALKDVVMTSGGNRAVRIGLGSVYAYAAIAVALRWTGPDTLSRMLRLDSNAIGQTALAWAVCVVDTYFAGLWISSGSDGQ